MNKKEYILKLLNALEGKRILARGLKILVEWNVLNDETIDSLVTTFSKAINEAQDEETKEKLNKWKEYLAKLKAIERDQHQKDAKEIEELDKILENF